MVYYVVKPIHCPNCGKELDGVQTLVDTHGEPGKTIFFVADHGKYDHIFDCFCRKCGWTGDIRPDVEEG